MPSLEESRRLLLGAVGAAPQMVFVRPFGNLGDEMIWAGTRTLLKDHIYREISVDEMCFETGELAVLSGGGAWSAEYNEYMPEALAIAEARFRRVIVFPSTFDASVPRVRDALFRTQATVFARERESFAQIRSLCDARLAHDCAFFCELPPQRPGRGTLNAFRTDAERADARELPPNNNDISTTAGSLDDWFAVIGEHAEVSTDRAHVMIAAARMGLRVNYSPSSYFKISAIAEDCLAENDVAPATLPGEAEPLSQPPAHPQVTVGIGHLPGAADTPYAIALDSRHQMSDRRLATLVDALDADPSAVVATHSGGWPVISENLFRVESADPGSETAPTGWAPLIGSLVRMGGDTELPAPEIEDPACRNADWILRLGTRGPGLILSVAQPAGADDPATPVQNDSLSGRAPRTAALVSHVEILDRHGLLLGDELLRNFPELGRGDGSLDEHRARLLIAATKANGHAWVLAEWMNGGLDPLLAPSEPLTPELAERLDWLERRNEMLEGIEAGGWWRLRSLLSPILRARKERKH